MAKIIQVFDHLLQRNEKVNKALREEKEGTEESDMKEPQKLTVRLVRESQKTHLYLWM